MARCCVFYSQNAVKLRLFFALIFTLNTSPSAWAWFCRVKLAAAVVVTADSPHGKKASIVDPVAVEEAAIKARQEAKKLREDPENDQRRLAAVRGKHVRSPEEVETWLKHFSSKIKKARDSDQKMSTEEFFGMIDAGMSRDHFRFADVFEEFGIKHVRLVGNSKFKEVSSKNVKDEIVIHVPDFPLDSPEAAALWVNDLYMTLYKTAVHAKAAKINAAPTKKEKKNLESIWTVKLKKLDKAINPLIEEMQNYLISKNPTKANPLNLPQDTLPSKWWFHLSSSYKVVDVFMGGGTGAYVGELAGGLNGAIAGGTAGIVLGYITKLKMPLLKWGPSLKWDTEASYALQRQNLIQLQNAYYNYEISEKIIKKTLKVLMYGAIGTLGVAYIKDGKMIGETEEGLDEESGNVAKLDDMVESQLATLNVPELESKLAESKLKLEELNAELEKAVARGDKAQIKHLNSQALTLNIFTQKILIKLEALSPEGLENER